MGRIEIIDERPKYDSEREKFRGDMNFDHPHEEPLKPEIYGDLMRIPISDSRGHQEYVLIDLKNWPRVKERGPWRLEMINDKPCATHRYADGGRLQLHRFIAKARGGQRVHVVNGYTLDCTERNLKWKQ